MTQITDPAQVFSPGSSHWIVADLKHSKWATKLDWYLNFQLRKASLHESKKISAFNQEKIAHWGFDLARIAPSLKRLTQEKSPLMIATHRLLPNRVTIQIPYKDSSTWASQCLKVLEQLKQNQARIFLPGEFSFSEFKKLVPATSHFDVVEETLLG